MPVTGFIKIKDIPGESLGARATRTEIDAPEAPGPMTAALLLPAVQQLALDHFEFNDTSESPYCVDHDPSPPSGEDLLASAEDEPCDPFLSELSAGTAEPCEPFIAELTFGTCEPLIMEDALF
ncbi:hypothetical protein [Dinoroseobacter sp. S124A]|uniref:hypothetical protein n=1 Tax=Dinoroseobacter sp. S124A TaxID=3415128 RepID=UPI003C7B9985